MYTSAQSQARRQKLPKEYSTDYNADDSLAARDSAIDAAAPALPLPSGAPLGGRYIHNSKVDEELTYPKMDSGLPECMQGLLYLDQLGYGPTVAPRSHSPKGSPFLFFEEMLKSKS